MSYCESYKYDKTTYINIDILIGVGYLFRLNKNWGIDVGLDFCCNRFRIGDTYAEAYSRGVSFHELIVMKGNIESVLMQNDHMYFGSYDFGLFGSPFALNVGVSYKF